ncbi:hypothetical protein CAPTEDRAFT_218677 [Capitella teleta]|uniref:Uncharacterized protein n=1 Tax=Capitella teleta TaxID=283909 RepID=R7VH50_CAPTE|nr:hypothetical protein CAPTEDRAFT_218677 [Capitella teleta]|eukprot:ELU18153.1 hypothetical protein CAPTEDRAFT_218677 [Capitella teleta]
MASCFHFSMNFPVLSAIVGLLIVCIGIPGAEADTCLQLAEEYGIEMSRIARVRWRCPLPASDTDQDICDCPEDRRGFVRVAGLAKCRYYRNQFYPRLSWTAAYDQCLGILGKACEGGSVEAICYEWRESREYEQFKRL